jgi:hypothetical protein
MALVAEVFTLWQMQATSVRSFPAQSAPVLFSSSLQASVRSFPQNLTRRVIGVIIMRVTGHKTRDVFDRYNITSEHDLEDAERKIELAQRLAIDKLKNSETVQVTEKTEAVTIQ